MAMVAMGMASSAAAPERPEQVLLCLGTTSVCFNVCVLLYAGTQRLLAATRKQCDADGHVCTSGDSAKDAGKLVASIVTGLATVVMATVALCKTDISNQPFVYYGDKRFLQVVFSAVVGRYLFLLALSVYLRHIGPRDRYVTCLHHVAAVACYVTATARGANLFLPLLAVFMELDQFLHDTLQLFRKRYRHLPRMLTWALSVKGLLAALFFRLALPIAGGALALTRQHPRRLDPCSLGVLCFGVFFFAVFNLWTVQLWVSRVRKCPFGASAHRPLIAIDAVENNALSLNQRSIRSNLITTTNPLPSSSSSPSSTFTKQGEMLLEQVAKVSNVQTAANLRSNFLNQAWSKDCDSVTRIGGVKAADLVVVGVNNVGVHTVDRLPEAVVADAEGGEQAPLTATDSTAVGPRAHSAPGYREV